MCWPVTSVSSSFSFINYLKLFIILQKKMEGIEKSTVFFYLSLSCFALHLDLLLLVLIHLMFSFLYTQIYAFLVNPVVVVVVSYCFTMDSKTSCKRPTLSWFMMMIYVHRWIYPTFCSFDDSPSSQSESSESSIAFVAFSLKST